MLQVVPTARTQGQFIDRRDVPDPGGGDEERRAPSAGGSSAEEPAQQRRATARGRPSTMRTGRGRPRSKGNSGAPSQRSGGATIMSSRCCTMWTCSSRAANGSIGDARAR